MDRATATLARASAIEQTADENYRKAQLDAAALNLRRQRQLLALASAHKSDVARAIFLGTDHYLKMRSGIEKKLLLPQALA
ncbi:MAG: hypothetical protein ABI217_02090 [Chthoniobacterales bacterium]